MANVIEITGKTVEEAIQAAAVKLGVDVSELAVEVLETPSKRLFGLLGETPAKIRATVKIPEPVAETVEPVAEAVEPVAETVEPVAETVEPVAETVEPVVETVEPVAETVEPVAETVGEPELPDHDRIIAAAKNFLQNVFATMDLEVTINVTEENDDTYLLDLVGKNLGVLIGKRGQALDALQYLLNLSVNRATDAKVHFIIDVEGYRRRREDALIKLARGVAERAIKTRRDVRLEPMNRHERKIIHTALQDNDRVETHSSGEEPYRYVIVTPVKRGKR
ncbi:MAG: Jag N-terminal domain-containing protein [Quinella sp. 2Q5]|nr:Jag N-terminal domain-containing protein [Quinella sp. 2Q5]